MVKHLISEFTKKRKSKNVDSIIDSLYDLCFMLLGANIMIAIMIY